VIKDSLINLSDLFLRIIVGGALYLIVLTHYFPPSELALYYLYVSLFNILGLFVSAPLLAQFDQTLDSKERARHALGAIGVLSLVEALVILAYIGRGGLALIAFTVLLNIVNNAYLLKFYNIESNRVLYSSIPYILKVGFTWVFAWLGYRDFEHILWAGLIPYVGVLALMVKDYGFSLSWKGLLEYLGTIPRALDIAYRGGSLFWVRVISAIRNYLDNILFNRPGVSDIEKTRYNTAAYIYKLFSESSGGMISINFLKYEKEGTLTLKRIVGGLLASFAIMVAFTIGVSVFVYLFPWVLKYDILEYVILLGIGYIFWSPSIIMRDTLFALNHTKEIVWAEVLSLAIFLLLGIGKDPWGVAQALVISLLAGFAIYGWFFYRALKLSNRL